MLLPESAPVWLDAKKLVGYSLLTLSKLKAKSAPWRSNVSVGPNH
jgi:hypothetical protein